MENSFKNVPDDLDSTVLRHQVRRYFNELNQESGSPLEFLSMKRKRANSAVPSEMEQKIIQTEMKLNNVVTAKDQLEHDMSNLKETCKIKIQHYEDKIEDLNVEIKQLHLRNEHMSKENLLNKEAVEHLKLAFTEEKLSCSQELAESEQKIIDLQLRYEEKIKEQEINLKNALLEASKYQMQNALFAQRTFSRSQEAKLARIQLENKILLLQETDQLYRETAANELLLKEKISALQESVQRYDEQCQAIHDLQGEMKKMASHLRDWESMADRLFDAESLSEVQIQVEDMRRKELKLVDENRNLQIEINSLNRSNSTLRDQIESLKNVTKTKSDLVDRVRKLERTLVVVQKDRDHYRTINEMYEDEMTRIGGPTAVSTEAKQIANLELLLEEYRGLVSTASTSMTSANNETV